MVELVYKFNEKPTASVQKGKSITKCHSNFFCSHIHTLIREYGSTLYVGLARAVSPTNTNFFTNPTSGDSL